MRQAHRVRISAAATAAIIGSLLLMPPAVAGQRPQETAIPREFGAAGSPIQRPCGEIDAAIARMNQGLPTQEGWLRSAEQQLRDAESGTLDSEAARRMFFKEALKDLVMRQLEAAATLKNKVAALQAAGRSRSERRKLLELAKKAEEIKEKADELKALHDAAETSGTAVDFGAKLRANTATLNDFLTFADESGLAEAGVDALANLGGPVTKLVAESGKVVIDFSLTMYGSIVTEEELQRARGDLERLRAAYSRNRGIVRDLRSDRLEANCPDPDATPEPEPAATPAPADSHLTPPLPEPEPPKRTSGTQAAAMGLGLAAAGGAGYLAYKYAMEAVELEGDSDTGSSGGSMTFVSGSFSCRYNSGGIVSSCADSVVTVNITKRLAVGSRLKLMTNHIHSSGLVATTRDPQGNITFRGFSGGGWFDQCGPPVTRLILVNTSVSTNGIAQITGISIPVTCR